MELNEIKKSLYKENPKAKLVSINQHSLLYGTELESNHGQEPMPKECSLFKLNY